MVAMLNTLLYVALVPLGFIFVYLIALSLFGLRVRRIAGGDPGKFRFAVLVPAHNEAKVIEHLIASLSNLNYDHDLLTILVVADHCDDDTVRILRDNNIDYIENLSSKRGKSVALAAGLAHLLESDCQWDALAVFDADNIIHPDFFRSVSRKNNGFTILQGNTKIYNSSENTFTRLNHINFVITNRFKELARSQAGLTCRLRGHGMVFPRNMLSHLACETASLVEDQDVLLKLVLSGNKVVWEHDAVVESIMPANVNEAKIQRQRWAGGKSVMLKKAVRDLLQRSLAHKDVVAFDLAVDFLMPSNAVFLAVLLLLALASIAANGLATVTSFYLLLVCGMLLYFLLGCFLEKVPLSFMASVLASPFLIFWRFWIYLSSLNGTMKWR